MENMLKRGDPCPCCGQPIKTNDPQLLLLLTLMRDHRRFREAAADAVAEVRRTTLEVR